MNLFLGNILLALVWMTLTGAFSPANLLAGYALGFLILFFARHALGDSNYFLKVWQGVSFFFFFLHELVLSNFRVAYDVVTPAYHMKPGVVAIPLDVKTPTEITFLANLITLTPGTLSLDVSDDRKVLYVHAMYVDDPEKVRRSIKEGFEKRVIELLR